MNPLTQIKNTQKATQREIVEGISDKASWHARYKHSGAMTGWSGYSFYQCSQQASARLADKL
jgi:hypothetical protein